MAGPMLTPTDLLTEMRQAYDLYYRLVLLCQSTLVEPKLMYLTASQSGARVMNVNLELSKLLLSLTHKQRKLKLGSVLEQAIADFVAHDAPIGEFVFLDHLDILFEPALESNPLALLQRASRNRVVVAVWHGIVEDGVLTYAQPNHPAFRRYPATDFLAFQLD